MKPARDGIGGRWTGRYGDDAGDGGGGDDAVVDFPSVFVYSLLFVKSAGQFAMFLFLSNQWPSTPSHPYAA